MEIGQCVAALKALIRPDVLAQDAHTIDQHPFDDCAAIGEFGGIRTFAASLRANEQLISFNQKDQSPFRLRK